MNPRAAFCLGALLTTSALLALVSTGGETEAEPPTPTDVLIVYFSGNPEVTRVPPVEAGPVDALTMPTPKGTNTARLAAQIAEGLRRAGFSVRLLKVDELRDPRLVLRAKVLLIGTPAYFAYPSWQSLRFVDEVGIRIYHTKGRLSGKWVGAFATGDLRGHARSAAQHLLRAAAQLHAAELPPVAVGRQTSEEEARAAVARLVEAVTSALR